MVKEPLIYSSFRTERSVDPEQWYREAAFTNLRTESILK